MPILYQAGRTPLIAIGKNGIFAINAIKSMDKKIVKTDFAVFELFDWYIMVTYRPGIDIDLETAKEIVKIRKEMTGSRTYPGLVEATGINSMSKSARDFFSSEEGREGLSAAALVGKTTFSNFMAKFFLDITVIRPLLPTRIFTNKKKALKWLEKYKAPDTMQAIRTLHEQDAE